jgi:hypothetical protein
VPWEALCTTGHEQEHFPWYRVIIVNMQMWQVHLFFLVGGCIEHWTRAQHLKLTQFHNCIIILHRTAMTWRKTCPSFLWIRLILHHAARLSNRKRDFFAGPTMLESVLFGLQFGHGKKNTTGWVLLDARLWQCWLDFQFCSSAWTTGQGTELIWTELVV